MESSPTLHDTYRESSAGNTASILGKVTKDFEEQCFKTFRQEMRRRVPGAFESMK